MEPSPMLLAIPEICERTGLSRSSVYQEIRSGRLRSVTVGRRRLIPKAALEDWMESLLEESAS